MKYDFETKLKAVLSKKAGHLIDEPYGEINRHWRDKVRMWERYYDVHGEEGLKRHYNKHGFKERLKLVKEVLGGKSIQQTSIDNNIEMAAIFKWVNIYRQIGIDGLKLDKKRSTRMPKIKKELKDKIKSNDKHSKFTDEEIEYILAENAYLKKLQALVQKENHKQK